MLYMTRFLFNDFFINFKEVQDTSDECFIYLETTTALIKLSSCRHTCCELYLCVMFVCFAAKYNMTIVYIQMILRRRIINLFTIQLITKHMSDDIMLDAYIFM